MKNKNYYPFDRNHYFYGKLLTVRDFEVEQKYYNNKRRLLNKLIKGAGVVAGLDVVLVDDQSVSVESGMALDYFGREIVIQEPVIKKLNLLDGFEQVKDSPDVFLCVEYDELLTEAVHSVVSTPTDAPNGQQYNRVTESYRLFLTDEPLSVDTLPQYSLQKEKKVIYQNHKVTIEQVVPRYVQQGQRLEVEVKILKKDTLEPLELSYEIETKYLEDQKGNKKIPVYYQEKNNKANLSVQLSYNLFANNVKETTEQLSIGLDNFSLKLGNEKYTLEQSWDFKVQVISQSINERIVDDYFSRDFSDILSGNQQAKLYLAKLNLVTANEAYIIESLEKMPYQQYVISNELLQLMLNNQIGLGVSGDDKATLEEVARQLLSEHMGGSANQANSFATGVEEIDLGFENTKNKSFFSNEIAHGLGSGSVALVLAVEDSKDLTEDVDQNVLIFGDRNIFARSRFATSLPEYQLGALAYPDKGTFRIGIHLESSFKASSIKVRWWAYEHRGDEVQEISLLELSNIKVLVSPDTVNLAPRGKMHFNALVEGTTNKECRWYVKEEAGGKIDHNGVYEAPNTEGVFEIIAESVKYPEKKASAFVVVKA